MQFSVRNVGSHLLWFLKVRFLLIPWESWENNFKKQVILALSLKREINILLLWTKYSLCVSDRHRSTDVCYPLPLMHSLDVPLPQTK